MGIDVPNSKGVVRRNISSRGIITRLKHGFSNSSNNVQIENTVEGWGE